MVLRGQSRQRSKYHIFIEKEGASAVDRQGSCSRWEGHVDGRDGRWSMVDGWAMMNGHSVTDGRPPRHQD